MRESYIVVVQHIADSASVVLNMSHCQMEALPEELATVLSLKALVASHNQLTSPSLTHVAGLTDLNSLILSDNQLTSLPSSITTLTALKKLSLSANKLRSDSLPDLSPLKTLEEIRLNGNAHISMIPEGLADLPVLSVLELSNTAISAWTEVDKLKSCQQLVNLGLKGTLLANQPDYKKKVIKSLPKLRVLDNDRFDPKFLQRKEKLRAKQAEETGETATAESTGEKEMKRDLSGKRLGDTEPALSAKQKGKRKATDQDEREDAASGLPEAEPRAPGRVRKLKKRRQTKDEVAEDEAFVLSDDEAAERARAALLVPRKKRSGNQRRLGKKAAAEQPPAVLLSVRKKRDALQNEPAKIARQIGGSLSESQQDSKKPEAAELEDLLKARSSVVGIVEADKGAKKGRKVKPGPGGADPIALLQQERTANSVVSGWD